MNKKILFILFLMLMICIPASFSADADDNQTVLENNVVSIDESSDSLSQTGDGENEIVTSDLNQTDDSYDTLSQSDENEISSANNNELLNDGAIDIYFNASVNDDDEQYGTQEYSNRH